MVNVDTPPKNLEELAEVVVQADRKIRRVQSALVVIVGVMACLDFLKPVYIAGISECGATAALAYNVVQRTKKRYENTTGLIIAATGLGIAGIEEIYRGVTEKNYGYFLNGIVEIALAYVTWGSRKSQKKEHEAHQLIHQRQEAQRDMRRIARDLQEGLDGVKVGLTGAYLSGLSNTRTDTSKN